MLYPLSLSCDELQVRVLAVSVIVFFSMAFCMSQGRATRGEQTDYLSD